MPPIRKISLRAARQFAVESQMLDRVLPGGTTSAKLLRAIRALGAVQIDAIHVVARSQYLVLLSRVGLYPPTELDALLYPKRKIVEYWAHVASLIPIEDYQTSFQPLVRKRQREEHRKLHRLGENPASVIEEVIGRIESEGPLGASAFEDDQPAHRTWWNWKPTKIALDILWEQGRLLVHRREGYRRIYDLAERVISFHAQTLAMSLDDWNQWALLRGIRALGVATFPEAADYYRLQRTPAKLALEALLAAGKVFQVEVEGSGEPNFIRACDLKLLNSFPKPSKQFMRTTFLSPFDNLIWYRSRVRRLFDFDYSFEAYVPIQRRARQHGYYVMPILHGDSLVGRIDPKADSDNDMLVLRSIALETAIRPSDELVEALSNATVEFMKFHGVHGLRIETSTPRGLSAALRKAVRARI